MRKQILVVMASFMMMSSAFPTYAATVVAGGATTSQEASTTQEATTSQSESSDGINWIIPRDTPTGQLNAQYGVTAWWKAETIAQAQKWAEDNKGDISSIADERARYEAVAGKVCDFLTYDGTHDYGRVHIAYVIRDGKGVCSAYTTLGKALCDAVGINAKVSTGANMSVGLGHNMLKVTLNGHEYYSDLSSHGANGASVLSESAPSWYKEDYVGSDLRDAAICNGDAWESSSRDVAQLKATDGAVAISDGKGGCVYLSKEDYEKIQVYFADNNMDAILAIYAKYGL